MIAAGAGTQAAQIQAQDRNLFVDVDQTGDAGGRLGQHRRIGGALHAHAQHLHEQQIQEHVHRHRADQKIQGAAAVPQGAEHRGGQIIQDRETGSQKHDKAIPVGIVKDLLRRAGQAQDLVGPEKGNDRDQRGKERAQPDGLPGAAAHGLPVAGAEALGDGDRKAGADAEGKAEDQKAQRARGADGGEGAHAEDAADQDAVGQVIELLEQIADQKRHAKGQHTGHGRARRHISCHKKSPSFLPRGQRAGGLALPFRSPYFTHSGRKIKRQSRQSFVQ